MTLFFYITIGLITFIAFLHAWSKKHYDLNRTIIINRPKAEVYAYIRQLQKQPSWMVWHQKDTGMSRKYKGEDGKVGASVYWKGDNKITGEGIQKITKVREGKVLEIQLLFLQPYKSLSLQYFGVKEVEPQRTKLIWGVRGTHKFPASVVTLFYGIERAIGKDFEQSLQNLKNNLEKRIL